MRVRNAVVAALPVVAIVGLALLVWQLSPLLLLAFGGTLVAVFLCGLTDRVAEWTGLPHGWSLTLVLLALVGLATLAINLSGDAVATQMAELVDQVPSSIEKLRQDISEFPWGTWLLKKAPKSANDFPISADAITSYLSSAMASLTGGIAGALIVLFLALYLAVDPQTYVEGAIRLLPVNQRKRVESVLSETYQTLQWWLIGKIISMFLVGVLTSVGLWLIGIPLALALGVVAALLTFVPNFGPILSAIPAVLLAFVESPQMAVYVIVLYLAIQTVESYLITPLIQQKTVSLPPGLTISAQVAMGLLFGAGGLVLATPLTAAMLVVVKRLYVEDALEADASH